MNNGEFYLQDAIDVIEEILAGGGEFCMSPKGTSMLPLIVQGKDSVVLSRNFEDCANRYDIAFYRRKNGQFVLHRVMRIEKDGSFTMCGDNQTDLEKGIQKEQIIGYVTKIKKPKKTYRTDGFALRVYTFFWCFMPYRKAVRYAQRIYRGVKRRIFKKKSV